MWRALWAAGLPIEAAWLCWHGNRPDADPSPEDWAEHWQGCIAGATAADVLLLYIRPDERHMGAMVECGAALAAGKQVYAVLPDEGLSIRHHPNMRVFKSLADAISALVPLMAAGYIRDVIQAAALHSLSFTGLASGASALRSLAAGESASFAAFITCVSSARAAGGRILPQARVLSGMGVIPGAPDVLLWFDDKAYALELKSESGRPTIEQLDMLQRLRAAGVFTALCHGLDRALAVLEGWGLSRGRVT